MSGNIINVIIVFYDVNLALYVVTKIYPRLECSITVFRSENLCLLTVTSIHSDQKNTKQKLQNKMKSDRQNIQGYARFKQVKRQRNCVDK